MLATMQQTKATADSEIESFIVYPLSKRHTVPLSGPRLIQFRINPLRGSDDKITVGLQLANVFDQLDDAPWRRSGRNHRK